MSNRQQRRAAMKKGKRPGETYADVLAKERMIKEAVEKTARDHSVAIEADIKTQRFLWMAIEADIKTQRFLWMAVIALHEAFGFGGERAKRFMLALEEVANDTEKLVKKHGAVYAKGKLMEKASKITGIEISPIWEEEMKQARLENEAKGIYFPEDDPDKW